MRIIGIRIMHWNYSPGSLILKDGNYRGERHGKGSAWNACIAGLGGLKCDGLPETA
jgi:hypothetical protein